MATSGSTISTRALHTWLPLWQGLKAHSIVMQTDPEAAITPHAMFLQYRDAKGRIQEPEVVLCNNAVFLLFATHLLL
jgi:hypothetical protein